MVRMFARQQVADYDSWRKVYDAFDRGSLGVRADTVYRDVADPNNVTVVHDFDDRQTAESFVNSDKLKATMEKAGVTGPPNIWITSKS
jgi:quinol monooxygenase YgiN